MASALTLDIAPRNARILAISDALVCADGVTPLVNGSEEPSFVGRTAVPIAGYDGASPAMSTSNYLYDDFERYDPTNVQKMCDTAIWGLHTQYNSGDCQGVPRGSQYSLVSPGYGGSSQALGGTYIAPAVGLGVTWLAPLGVSGLETVRFNSAGWCVKLKYRIGVGESGAPNGCKFFEAWWKSSTDAAGTGRIQFAADWERWSMTLGTPQGTTVVNRSKQPVRPYWSDVYDGQWHEFSFVFRRNTTSTYSNNSGFNTSATEVGHYTGTSSRDGYARMFIDGVKVCDYSQAVVGITPSGGANPWCYQGDVDMLPAGVELAYLRFPDVVNAISSDLHIDNDDLRMGCLA